MNYAHLLEATMLVCFGFSWPLNVVKAYKSRTAKGTSLAFIVLIITGYIAGIFAKIINGQFNYVLVVYFINLAIVSANVFVYFRNKSIDFKTAGNAKSKYRKLDIQKIQNEQEKEMLNYSNSLDEIIHKSSENSENTNAVILMGGTIDKLIPVEKLAKEFGFNFDIYNKSKDELSIKNSAEYFKSYIAPLFPEGIMIHLGDEDISLFKNDSAAFDNYYLTLIDEIKLINKNARIALLSVSNSLKDKSVSLMNAHIKAIAQTEKATFINLESAKLWNPEATKAASEFAYSMGLRIRKPLKDVAEILYSYAYHNIPLKKNEIMVG